MTVFVVGCSNNPPQACSQGSSLSTCSERLEHSDGHSIYHGQIHRHGLKSVNGDITLPFTRFSTGKNKPAVFFLGGGPGLSNLGFTPPASLLKDFDVIVMEYRGVGKSSIELKSPYFKKALFKLKGELNLSAAEELRPYYQKGFQHLKDQGIVFEEFSVSAIADDIEFLRQQLGYKTINFLGHSFGTRIALQYKALYPAQVDSSVLFALNTPGGFIWYPDQTQSLLHRYQVSLENSGSDKSEPFKHMLNNQKDWPTRWFGIPADPARALFGAFMLTYNRHTAGFAYNAMLGAQKGNSFSWFALSKTYGTFIRMGFNWSDLFLKAYLADCNPQWIQAADEQGRDTLFQSPSSILFAGYREFKEVSGICEPKNIPLDFTNTLVVTGEFDPSTPLERIPSSLPEHQHIVVQNYGHADPLYRNKELAGKVISNYLLHGQADPYAFGFNPVFEPRPFTQ